VNLWTVISTVAVVVMMLRVVLAVAAMTMPVVLLGSVLLFFTLDGPFPSFRSLVALSLLFPKCDTNDYHQQQLLAHHNNNGIRIIIITETL
jgi:hypothetical protein